MQQGQQNILEARTLVFAVKHACRALSNWDHRLLVVSDSLVRVGLFSKGRSSKRGLLRQSRVAAAYLLGFGIRLTVGYTSSGVNFADGPSRQQKLGVATKKKPQRLRAPGWEELGEP